jgi:tetratricopeptide (TPR) repeat protein
VFFLVLRHYPEAGGVVSSDLQKGVNLGLWGKLKFGGKEAADQDQSQKSIEEAIINGQDHIIAPAEVSNAQKKFYEEDPEIARLLLESKEALEQNDLRAAEERAIEAITKEKKCAQAYVVMGRIAYLRGSFDDARESYKTAIKCNRDLGEAYYGLGEIELQEENFTEAIDQFSKAVSLDRGNATWHAELGKAFMQIRQYSKAAKAFKKAANLDIDTREYKDLATEAENKLRTHSMEYRIKN